MIQFAKKTGDYAVLSHPDLAILALTHALNVQSKDEVPKGAEKQAEDTAEQASTEVCLTLAVIRLHTIQLLGR